MRAAAALALALCGCGLGETEWDRQLAAVRAGESDAIVLTSGRVTSDDLYELFDWDWSTVEVRRLSLLRRTAGPPVCDGGGFAALITTLLSEAGGLDRLEVDAHLGRDFFQGLIGRSTVSRLNLPRAEPAGADDLFRLAVTCPRLRSLRLRAAGLKDAGWLRFFPGLTHLHLLDAPLTDADVPALAGARRLESLYLDGTAISSAGRAELARLRPDLHLHFDGGHR